jgi:uncharacterized protein YbjT (DUF2867 family)
MADQAKKVIVAGATGTLGNKIVKALLDQGAEVTAMVRSTSNKSKLEDMGLKNFVIGDMMDKSSLQEALSNTHSFDAIVSSVAGYTSHTKGDSPITDTIGYRNLVDATKEAGIPRFVMVSILECDKAKDVPHFYNKYLAEKYLVEKRQPFIALRAGAFLDQTRDFILPKITKGILPVFFQGSEYEYGMIYTPDLARYVAIAATTLPDSALNKAVDVGWDDPVNEKKLAAAFEKALKKQVKTEAAIPPFVVNVVFPLLSIFNSGIRDMLHMIKWVKTGAYISKNTQLQKELFGDLPTVEEAIRRYCKDRDLVSE